MAFSTEIEQTYSSKICMVLQKKLKKKKKKTKLEVLHSLDSNYITKQPWN